MKFVAQRFQKRTDRLNRFHLQQSSYFYRTFDIGCGMYMVIYFTIYAPIAHSTKPFIGNAVGAYFRLITSELSKTEIQYFDREQNLPSACGSLLPLHNVRQADKILSSFFNAPSTVESSSTVKVIDVNTVPLVVMHLILGCLSARNSRACLADSATFRTCWWSGFGIGAVVLPPFDKPSNSFSTETRSTKMFLEARTPSNPQYTFHWQSPKKIMDNNWIKLHRNHGLTS